MNRADELTSLWEKYNLYIAKSIRWGDKDQFNRAVNSHNKVVLYLETHPEEVKYFWDIAHFGYCYILNKVEAKEKERKEENSMLDERVEILRVLVGSHAHGLATEESDLDYRSVFITPTSEILKLGANSYKGTSWLEGETEDNTSWELGHFLHLATKSNPSILEVFKAPIHCKHFDGWHEGYEGELSTFGQELRELFSFVWSSKGVYEAFKGYSHNQHKKMFDDKEEFAKRKFKYAVAHIRVLLQGIELLTTNDFSTKIKAFYLFPKEMHLHLPYWAVNKLEHQRAVIEGKAESWVEYLMAIKRQEIAIGNIVDTADYLKIELKKAYEKNLDKQTDLDKVNEFLLKVRKEIW